MSRKDPGCQGVGFFLVWVSGGGKYVFEEFIIRGLMDQ